MGVRASQFFLNGKVLPIDRGGGMQQPIMNVAARQVQRGRWLHVFPEGKLFVDGSMGPFKWGIGKMVCDSMEEGRRSVYLFYSAEDICTVHYTLCKKRFQQNKLDSLLCTAILGCSNNLG